MSLVVVRDSVTLDGPDAEKYLQGQLSNEVAALGEGSSAWAFLLEPSGKLGHLVRVRRVGASRFVLDSDAGTASAIEARLRRFLIRTKVTIETGTVAVDLDGGPGDPLVGWWGEGDHAVTDAAPGADDAALAERRRVVAGWPGPSELTEGLIPGESGVVAVAASFTKGCYTGQELVARIDSRGNNVPFHLRRLRFEGDVEPGAALMLDGESVGRVTSVSGRDGLGYVARRVDVPAEVEVGSGRVAVEAQRPD